MRLKKVEIRNFRSIEDVTVDFEQTCRVLVGINEAGKSNILKALSFIEPNLLPVKKNDLREPLPDEDLITESYIRFVFKFEKNETDQLFETVSSKILTNLKKPSLFSKNEETLTLKDFCNRFDEGLYVTDIMKESKQYRYWRIGYSLVAGWKKPSKHCPQDFIHPLNGENFRLAQYSLVNLKDYVGVPDGYLEDASISDVQTLIGLAITSITKANLPSSLFWEYDEKNLLPNSVQINAFSSDPDICSPLKNMFILAGITNINESINEARKGTDNQFQNYLDRIAKKTTRHFREVWKNDYKDIEFSLRLNADQLIPGVKEKNIHDFSRRSDGFKRFITFLLMISVNVKTDMLCNTLLLIDEPDISLHPTGARYLRDELIRISKKNQVIYSTHSIFMIDSGDISRHYIVKKNKEITSINSAGVSNIADEEVLYNALGHSVFSILKEKNIIFEGWRDKRLFNVFIENATADMKSKMKNIGVCHARGVKNIKAITPLIDLANRKCLIVSDSDKPAKEHQKIYKQEKGYGEWKTYQDIDSTLEAVTGEDFLKNDYISKQVQSVLKNSNLVFDVSVLPLNRGKIIAIQKWLIDNGMNNDQVMGMVNQIKDTIFENIQYSNIENSYRKLVKGII